MVKVSQKKTSKAKVAKSRTLPRRGGRTKGTPNKRTAILNGILVSLGHDVPQNLMDLMPKLSSDKQADVYLKLMEFLYPKRKAVDVVLEQVRDEVEVDEQRQRLINIMHDPKAFKCAEYLVDFSSEQN